MNKRNYQKELDKKLEELQKGEKLPTLFLHSCCAPCSSYVLEYLSRYFEITVFYYNPNIYPPSEYEERINIRVIIKYRDLKISGKIFQNITAAGRTAAV